VPGPVLLILLVLNTSDVDGLSNADLAQRAEAEFNEGVRLRHAQDKARPHFRAAAEQFAELRRRGVHNALLYRNLGNAYLLAGDPPRAILSYRRGLQLRPGDRDLRANLGQARQQVVYAEGERLGRPIGDPGPPWLPHLEPGWLFASAFGAYALSCLLLTRWLMVRRTRWLLWGLTAVVVAAVLTIFLIRSEQSPTGGPLVVIAEDRVLLRKGNGLAYPPRYDASLNRGVEARLLFRRGDWLQIELAGGEVGWIPLSAALVDGEEGSQ
jgi:tetratricopeptide (TPR) repeat protein